MRFVKPIQIALGLVATSGVALVLSGGAWAADSSAGMTSQDGKTLAQLKQVQTVVSNGGTVVVHDDHSQASGSGAVAQTSVTPHDGASTGSELSSPPATGSTGLGAVVPTSKGQPVVGSTPSQTPAANADSAAGHDSGSVAPLGSLQPPTPGGTPDLAGQTQTTSVSGAALGGTVGDHTIVFRSAILPIQPTITSRSTMPEDLAATVPSAPAPTKAPAPIKASGLIGQLAAELAGTVVPQPFLFPVNALAWSYRLAATLILLIVGWSVRRNFTYGSWLKRGGFVTAARSDVANLFSYFATPLLLGYGSTPVHLHSPVLVVSDTKTSSKFGNAYGKEEMKQ